MTTSTKWITRLRGSKQWKPEAARCVLGAWKESGESMVGFASRHGLNGRRIAWWRDRLPASPLWPPTTSSPSVTLVPVTVRSTSAPTVSGPVLSLMVGDVVRVEVGRRGGRAAGVVRRRCRGAGGEGRMILLPSSVQVYVAVEPASLHKSFEGFANAVRSIVGRDPLSGHVLCFLNRRRTALKLLLWTRGGFTTSTRCSRAEGSRSARASTTRGCTR